MLISNHVSQGALVGRAAARPARAFLLGLASHFLADSLPHWGNQPGAGGVRSPAFLRIAVPDGLTGLALMALLTSTAPPERRAAVFAGMAGACLPDLDKPFKLVFSRSPWPRWVDSFHHGIQRESAHRMPQELVLISAGAALALLALRPSR